jgi:hypothetical protein
VAQEPVGPLFHTTPANMFRQKRDVPIPSHDLVSFIYEGYARDIDTPACVCAPDIYLYIADRTCQVYVDASNPSRFYTVRSAKQTVSRLVAGLRHAGLKKGDTVLVNSAGDVSCDRKKAHVHSRIFLM